MGPRSVERGNDAHRLQRALVLVIASMGPRSVERGNLAEPTGP